MGPVGTTTRFSGPAGHGAPGIPVLGLLAVFETEDFARALQGEPAFADQEQQ